MELWHGGTIYTMTAEGDTVEAVLVDNGVIQATGTVEELREKALTEVDLKGKVLYPGFVDSHLHMVGHGENLSRLDLSGVTSSAAMKEKLLSATASVGEDEWFFGEGWDENNFPDRKIFHRSELDEITQSPMMLKRVCRHAVVVNSKALELAGITKDTKDPDGGVIVRDDNGEPTGFLLDAAQELVFDAVPEVTVEYLTNILNKSVDHLLSLGLTGGHTEDMGYYGDYRKPLQAFKNVIGENKKFRAHLLRHHSVFEEMIADAEYAEPFIEPGAMKIFADGSIGGRTALLRKPYADDPSTKGVAIHTDEELDEMLQKARKHNEAVAIHVIGDWALDKALTAIEAHPVPAGKRDRLIHTMVMDEALAKRMSKLDVVLDLQPQFVTSDFPWVMERLGEDRLDWAYPWKKLLSLGLICAGSSDAPVEDANPLLGIHAAVTRREAGETHEGYLPEEKLSRFEAVSLYTTGSAAAILKEETRGKIAAGFDADFTVLDNDLFNVPEDEILSAQVELTVVAGDVMFQKGEEQ